VVPTSIGARVVASAIAITALGGASAIAAAPRIVLTRETVGGPERAEIVTVGASGRHLIRLTHGHFDLMPDWGPDRNRIVFARLYELRTLRTDGSGLRTLTHGETDADPDWSPDGELIAFDRFDRGEVEEDDLRDIFTIRPNGTQLRRLTGAPGESWSPTWSPGGTKIAYVQAPFEEQAQIWRMSADGHHRRRLTDLDNQIVDDPAWSPDGRTIAFTCNHSICTVPHAGGTVDEILPSHIRGEKPTWSRDSERILFHGSRQEHGRQDPGIYSIHADGHGLRRILADPSHAYFHDASFF
jgi:Tol biopolymer transport system component